MFSGVLAAFSITIVVGAVIERIKFVTWIIFSTLWVPLVYSVVAHWVWHENGFLYKSGYVDHAGGTVIHITAGITGLIACLCVGKREEVDYDSKKSSPQLMLLGVAIL